MNEVKSAVSGSLWKRRETNAEQYEAVIKPDEAKKNKKIGKLEHLMGAMQLVYNPEYREFLSRDALGWFKLTCFYCIFYSFLSGFFILLLAVFYRMVDDKQPTYFNKESVMNYRGVNPGLGFRPQIDPESELVYVNTSNYDNLKRSLDIFLEQYEKGKELNFTAANRNQLVSFNYEEIIKNTPCSPLNNFGFNTTSPCVLVKLNRIYGWTPVYNPQVPKKYKVNVTEVHSRAGLDRRQKYVYVLCDGEGGADKENIQEIEYYSSLPSKKLGGIHFKYFPYMNQENYLSPLVFVHFKQVTKNLLLNIECKAFAANIDNTDRLNMRGMVKFQLFVTQ